MGTCGDPDDAIYLSAEKLASQPLLKDLARLAEDYNPQTEVAVIFLQPPHSVSAYKGGIQERGTPPELYDRLKPFLHEN